jgi:hypothetical protein
MDLSIPLQLLGGHSHRLCVQLYNRNQFFLSSHVVCINGLADPMTKATTFYINIRISMLTIGAD